MFVSFRKHRDENSCLIRFIHPGAIIILHSSWLLMSRLRGVLAWDHLSRHMAAWCLSLSHYTNSACRGLSACSRWELNASMVEQGMAHPRLVVPEKMCRITHDCQIRFAHPLITQNRDSLVWKFSSCTFLPAGQVQNITWKSQFIN